MRRSRCLSSILALFLALAVLLPPAFPAAAAGTVPGEQHHWYSDAASRLRELGIIDSIPQMAFVPEGLMTRSMFAWAFYKADGSPPLGEGEMHTFRDVSSDAWCAEAVLWAWRNQVMIGYSDTAFGPGDAMTKEMFARLTWNHMGSPAQAADVADFPDQDQVSSWATEAVNSLHSAGLIIGNEKGMFEPQKNITQAEAATLICRYLDYLKDHPPAETPPETENPGGTDTPGTSDPGSSSTPGTSDPGSSSTPGTSDPGSSSTPGTSDPGSSSTPGTSDPGSSSTPGTSDPGSSSTPGTSDPGSSSTPGTSDPGSSSTPGTSTPGGTQTPPASQVPPHVTVQPQPVPANPYDKTKFYKNSYGYLLYDGQSEGIPCHTGIDVSAYQRDIDWKAVADSGVEFAIIRAGFRGYGSAGNILQDQYFHQNMKGALENGIQVGVYFFSQAVSIAEAEYEANLLLEWIKDYDVTYPVVFDWERVVRSDSRTNNTPGITVVDCTLAFCRIIEEAGYIPMTYGSPSTVYYDHFDLSYFQNWPFWLAHYTINQVPTGFKYKYQIWQYSCTGTVPGIEGNVDMDLCLTDISQYRRSQENPAG